MELKKDVKKRNFHHQKEKSSKKLCQIWSIPSKMISRIVSHFKIPKNLTKITQFRRELMKKAKNGWQDSKMRKFHENANAKISGKKMRKFARKKEIINMI